MPRMTPTGRQATCAVTEAHASRRSMHTGQNAPPARRIGRPVGQQKPDRPSCLLAEPSDPGELGFFVLEIAVHAKGTGISRAQARADPGEFVSAQRPGTISPEVVLCALVREVVQPKAPARIASSVSRRISAMPSATLNCAERSRCRDSPLSTARRKGENLLGGIDRPQTRGLRSRSRPSNGSPTAVG